jgi:hypothetical protein
MGLSMITWAGAFGALRRLLAALLPVSATARRHSGVDLRTHMHQAPGSGHIAWPAAQRRHDGRPLRVLRVVDAAHGPSTAGRMVISGRMADVCAELDRLAALEAAAA